MKKIKYLKYSFKEVYNNGTGFFYLFIIKSLLYSGKIYLTAWLSKCFFNELATAIQLQTLSAHVLYWAFLVIFTDVLFSFTNLILNFYLDKSSAKYNNNFSIKNAKKCARLKYEYHDSPSDKNEVKQFLADGASVLNVYCQTITILLSIISFAVSLYISLSFSILVTVFALIASFPSFFIKKKNRNADYKLEKDLNLKDRMIDYFRVVCTGKEFYKETHLFNTLPYFFSKLKSELDDRLEKTIILQKTKIRRETVLLIIFSIVNIIINLYIIAFIIIKKLTIGDFTYYTSIINNLKNNSNTVVSSFNEFLLSLKKTENYYNFFLSVDNEYDFGSQPMPTTINSISFQNVWFKYPNSSNYVLKNVTFEVNSTEKIALAGINGAGKTTIINLLLRFYEPSKGVILINSTDVRIYKLQDYWSRFSCMFQQANLYNLTLKENLLFAKLNELQSVDSDTLCSSLSSLGIRLPAEALDLHISKQFYADGLIFSPGQAQKVNIVRTLLNDAPVVILDEPSSSMDVLTEDTILETAFSASKGKILFFISHRLSNLKKVDKIILLENGSIIEIGTHEELMANKQLYYNLFNTQSNKYL